VVHGRVASGREVIVSSVLIIIGASLIAVTRGLIMIRPRLILIACILIAVTRGLIMIRPHLILIACSLIAGTRGLIVASLNTVARVSRKLRRELGAAGRTYENGVNLAAGWTGNGPRQSSRSSLRAQARLATNSSGVVFSREATVDPKRPCRRDGSRPPLTPPPVPGCCS
jgi:hypothetical protein